MKVDLETITIEKEKKARLKFEISTSGKTSKMPPPSTCSSNRENVASANINSPFFNLTQP